MRIGFALLGALLAAGGCGRVGYEVAVGAPDGHAPDAPRLTGPTDASPVDADAPAGRASDGPPAPGDGPTGTRPDGSGDGSADGVAAPDLGPAPPVDAAASATDGRVAADAAATPDSQAADRPPDPDATPPADSALPPDAAPIIDLPPAPPDAPAPPPDMAEPPDAPVPPPPDAAEPPDMSPPPPDAAEPPDMSPPPPDTAEPADMSAPPADAAEPPDTAPPPDTATSPDDAAGAAVDSGGGAGLDAPPGCLVVTTAADEDNGATNGLSLREALAAANATAGHDCITFSGPMTIRPTTNLPVLEDPAGASIFGGGVVFIDGAMNTTAARRALQFSEGNNTVSGLEMGNLPNEANDVCIHAKSSNNTIGPAVYLHDCGQGMQIEGNDNEVKASRFARNGSAIKVNPNSMRARLWLNVFTDNLTEAIQMNAPATDSFLRHNTFFRNPHGLKLKGVIVRVAVQNNVFVSMGTTDNGITYDAGSTFMPLDHNDFFGFAANRACDGCMGLMGPNTLSVDPMFVSPAGGDLRLQPGSPVIDKGIDTLLDVNGAAAGLYNGSAPDMGAFESP